MYNHNETLRAQGDLRFTTVAHASTRQRIAVAMAFALGACGVEAHPEGPAPGGSSGGYTSSSGGYSSGGYSSGGTSGGGSSSGGGSGGSASGTGSSSGTTVPTDDGGGVPPVADGGDAGSGPPLSGITVNINGMAVPKEKVIAFIHFGHSNMAGRGDAPLTLRPFFFTAPAPHAWIASNGSFQPALEPNTAGDSGNQTAIVAGQTLPLGGPGTAIMKLAAAMAPGYYFVSLGFARGSSYCSQFLPGHLYYDNVMTVPRALKGLVTFGGIFVMLGITERHGTAQDITGYPDCINMLITSIRNELGEPNLPLLLTDYEMSAVGTLAPTTAFAQQIIPYIHMVPSVVSNSALVPTDGLPLADASLSDGHHFNLQGHQTWSQSALDIMKTKGWFPW